MRRLTILALLLSLTTCKHAREAPRSIPSGISRPFDGYSSAHYAPPSTWLCRPDKLDDPCHLSLDATELRPDGSRVVVPMAADPDPKIDCFYVYPTVDLSLGAANHTDFSDLAPMSIAARAQIARFASKCALYAPLYRQVTIGTYALREADGAPYFDTAYSDVADAFLHYVGSLSKGRKFVLIGHSQGAQMLTRLLKERVDDDPALRDRLLLALVIGGNVEVPTGRDVGGTFEHLPLCTHDAQLGCIIAYRSHRAGADVTPDRRPSAGHTIACVNPADVTGNRPRLLSSATFGLFTKRASRLTGVDGITTPFVTIPDFYQAKCVDGPDGYRYLEIATPHLEGDVRRSPVDFDHRLFQGKLGLHILDYQLPQGELIDLVAARAR